MLPKVPRPLFNFEIDRLHYHGSGTSGVDQMANGPKSQRRARLGQVVGGTTQDSEVTCGFDSFLEVSAFQRGSGLVCQEMRTTDVGSWIPIQSIYFASCRCAEEEASSPLSPSYVSPIGITLHV